MTTEQKNNMFKLIADRFPDGRVDLPTEQSITGALATLEGLLGDLPVDAKLLGSSIVGEKIIVKYWV